MKTMQTTDELLKPTRCVKCGQFPSLAFDEQARAWDCFHICYDFARGSLNAPTHERAIEEWNEVNQ